MKRLFIVLGLVYLQVSLFAQSIFINEVSQGPTGAQEYVEFIITGPALTYCSDTPPCMDLRGYIIDDNNGFLNGTPTVGVGIAAGACRFSNDPFWSCIPAGTVIVIYNDADTNQSIAGNDISMTDGNCQLSIPISSTLFEHHNTLPSSSNSSYSSTGWISGGAWQNISMANGEDGFQIYAPGNLTTPVFSIGWGPDNTLGTIYMGTGSASGTVFSATDCNFTSQTSWVSGNASTDQTPGTTNNATQADCIGLMNNNCNPPVNTMSSTPESCAGACDGTATSTVTGGTPPFTYSWSPAPSSGQGTNTISGLCPGWDYVTITDNNGAGCIIQDSVEVMIGPSCCALTYFYANIGACDGYTNDFSVSGTVTYSSPPSTGTLIVTISNSLYSYDTIINPPFSGNDTWSISGLPSNGDNLIITTYFTADSACSMQLNSTAPQACGCVALAGTFTAGMTGDGLNNYVLCYGDQINISSDLNYTSPNNQNVSGVTYDPGIAYLAYTCPPTVFPPAPLWDPTTGNPNDPCLIGVFSFGDVMTDVNTTGVPPNLGATYTNNTIYYVPITTYSNTNGVYAISINNGPWCYDMGTPFAVQYLPQITTTNTVTCTDVTVTINGGLPAVDGSNFTLSNLMPATASLSTTSVANGGTVTITGLQNGDSYSFDITDGNGCPITFNGGPFVGMPVANAGPDGQSCTLSYTLAAVPSVGTGTWTGLSGGTFSSSSSATATVTVPGAGSYSFVWTENNGGCIDSDTVTVIFSNLSYTENVTQSTCGNADGTIMLTASNGIPAYTYSIDGGTTFQSSGSFTGLLANSYSVVVQDSLGCQSTGTSTVTDQGGPTINSVVPVDITCNAACDGSIAINATGATQFSIDGGATYQGTNSFTGLCAGFYNISVQNAIGCIVTDTISVTEPPVLTYSATTTDLLCNNVCTGVVAVTSSGGTGSLQYSSDNGTSFQPSSTFNNLCAGTYNMLVQDANGCQITGAETINQPPALTLTLGVQDASCFGVCDGTINSIPVGGTTPYTYIWGPSGTGGNVPLVSNLCTGTYTLSIQDQNGCTVDTTISVSGPQAVTINNINTTDVQCFGDCNGIATITATNAAQYSIDGVNYTSSNSFTGLCAGNYVAYAKDANGCEISQPFVINSPTEVVITVASDTTICIGGAATLTSQASGGVGGYTYSWDNGSTTQNEVVSPTSQQTYCVAATDANGCAVAPVCVNVNLYQPLSVQAFSDTIICPGSSANISAQATGGMGAPYNYSWNQGVGSGSEQIVLPGNTTTYIVTATDGCETPSDTASVTITVLTLPNISFSGDTSGCSPVIATVVPNGVPVGSTYSWSFGDGQTATDTSVFLQNFTQPGCWDATLSITTPEGCVVDTTYPNYVCVFDYPNPDFTFEPQPTTVMDPTINFTNTSTNATSFTWYFDTNGANDSTIAANPSYTFPEVAGEYEVCLMAVSPEGCIDRNCQEVIINEFYAIYVPNAFTPDADGINELFTPIVSGIDPENYNFLVFNRWGELIYESHTPGQGWDGTYQGVKSQIDVYVWKLRVKDAVDEKYHDFIGHVSLLR